MSIARSVAPIAALLTALWASFSLDIRLMIAIPTTLVAFFLAYHLASWRWLRGAVVGLFIPLILLLGVRALFIRDWYVSVSRPSPDGLVVAEVYELPRWIDRNFDVRLKTKWLVVIPRYKRVFRSSDEGAPGTERLISW